MKLFIRLRIPPPATGEGKHSPHSSSLSFHAASSPGICNLGELSMFHQSERAGFGGAADVDEMFLGKKEQTTEGGGADGLSVF